jgi:putative ABC transport system ATP-binding protein
MKETALKIKDVVKTYEMGKKNIVYALNGVNLAINKGEMVAIMGPSGSGKSTLLNMLGILDRPTKGEVLIGDLNTSDLSRSKLAAIRNLHIGYIFQNYSLIPSLTALENVILPLKYAGMKKSAAKEKALEELDKVGLKDRADHLPTELSGGQQQKVAVARALVNNPDIILADEPTGNLDTKSGNEIIAMMLKLNKELGQTFVMVTHNPEVAKKCHRIIHVVDGKIVDKSSRK